MLIPNPGDSQVLLRISGRSKAWVLAVLRQFDMLQVFQVSEDGRSARLLTSAVNLSGEAAAGLYGGALLGVKLHRVQRVGE